MKISQDKLRKIIREEVAYSSPEFLYSIGTKALSDKQLEFGEAQRVMKAGIDELMDAGFPQEDAFRIKDYAQWEMQRNQEDERGRRRWHPTRM